MLAISVENVSKKYRLGEIDRSLLVREWAARLRGKRRDWETETDKTMFWALKDISFEVTEGETISIIGRNGAGKSTLLKLLSRITAPTAGVLRMRGRIASLLEVGTGFHQELTGRDNIFLNGSIMGMTRQEVRAKFDQIVDFSGLAKFIDTPVKRYSSGMHVRLAFSIAAHLEPEILILDEVLAVGDQHFHNQCIDRINEIVRDGRTILLVSHNMSYIRRLSQRTLWLHQGTAREFGSTEEVVNRYEAASAAVGHLRKPDETRAAILSWRLTDGYAGEPNVLSRPGAACRFEFAGKAREHLADCRMEFRISDQDEVPVLVQHYLFPNTPPGEFRLDIHIPALPLQPGQYRLEVRLFQRHEEVDRWACDPLLVVSEAGVKGPVEGLLHLPGSLRFSNTRRPEESDIHP